MFSISIVRLANSLWHLLNKKGYIPNWKEKLVWKELVFKLKCLNIIGKKQRSREIEMQFWELVN